MNFRRVPQAKLDTWFRDYLRAIKLNKSHIGIPVDEVSFPIKDVYKESLPKDVPLRDRRITYYASKFIQWWSAKQLRYSNDLIHKTLPDIKTGTLMPSHGFLGNAWGPTKIGMTYQMLDIFEVAEQESGKPNLLRRLARPESYVWGRSIPGPEARRLAILMP